MSDDRDFAEKTQDYWANRGHEWSAEKAQEHFSLHGPHKRAEAMDQLDAELRSIEPAMGRLREYTELHELKQKLGQIHHTLIRAKR
jgi:hypothetical protein